MFPTHAPSLDASYESRAAITRAVVSVTYLPKSSQSSLFSLNFLTSLRIASAAPAAACKGGSTPDAAWTAVRTGTATLPPASMMPWSFCFSDIADNGRIDGRGRDRTVTAVKRTPHRSQPQFVPLWEVLLRQILSILAELAVRNHLFQCDCNGQA
ncbi:uncharacterized protein EI90DRAFT_3067699 [Cantharellus anzutake]|uniref:uncharacterized protein n=1 Tax=Cantharellus anzutake TaxID=1750568 RepID=UPI0019044579|nr:uncharacterized protein EI90DRAFT_3067699 [Cantharellus anzutake]KAF8327425.1 hypothetical protein EI90DRAFT_3067699 [Cantharellus anzutake]